MPGRVLVLSTVLLLSCGSVSALDLTLRCDGVGTFPESHSATVQTFGVHPTTGDVTTYSRGSVSDQMMVNVGHGAVSVQLPKSITPPLHSGGPDNWWKLYDVQITEDEITGRFRLNLLNKPSVRIDRSSGRIDVEGSWDLSFKGTCEPYTAGDRKF